MIHKPGSLEEAAFNILSEGISTSDKKKIIDAIKKGKTVSFVHKFLPNKKNLKLGYDRYDGPYMIDGPGSEGIGWNDVISYKIEK